LSAVNVIFDYLHADYEPLLDQPLEKRRERLQKPVKEREEPEIVFSGGVVGQGRAFFETVCEEGWGAWTSGWAVVTGSENAPTPGSRSSPDRLRY
jgi:hypothetical protein